MTGPMSSLLVLGGARSGKSTLAMRAIEAAARTGGRPVTVCVTGVVTDAEMADRIARHQADRPADWTTVEAPTDLDDAVPRVSPDHAVLVDCVSVWLSNLLLTDETEEAIEGRVDRLGDAVRAHEGPVVLVSNEVGQGVVPPSALGRRFRDIQGRANQQLADSVDRTVLAVAGRWLDLGRADELPWG